VFNKPALAVQGFDISKTDDDGIALKNQISANLQYKEHVLASSPPAAMMIANALRKEVKKY